MIVSVNVPVGFVVKLRTDLSSDELGGAFARPDVRVQHRLDPAVRGAILLSPPLRFSEPAHLSAWAGSGKPLTAVRYVNLKGIQ